MTPDVDHTPAGGSPPRPVPKEGDWVKIVRFPDDLSEKRLRIGQRGLIVSKREAMFQVMFPWGYAYLNALQIELVR
jgi:hypothetical protein